MLIQSKITSILPRRGLSQLLINGGGTDIHDTSDDRTFKDAKNIPSYMILKECSLKGQVHG